LALLQNTVVGGRIRGFMPNLTLKIAYRRELAPNSAAKYAAITDPDRRHPNNRLQGALPAGNVN
jgi:hypothetical protein